MSILCIDPGPKVSGAVVYHPETQAITRPKPEIENRRLLRLVEWVSKHKPCVHSLVIEMIEARGYAVDQGTFETARWVGVFQHAFGVGRTHLMPRRKVIRELLGGVTASDAMTRAHLMLIFPQTGGGRRPAIGTKKQPGPLYGLTKHSVQALAAGVAWHNSRYSRPHVQPIDGTLGKPF